MRVHSVVATVVDGRHLTMVEFGFVGYCYQLLVLGVYFCDVRDTTHFFPFCSLSRYPEFFKLMWKDSLFYLSNPVFAHARGRRPDHRKSKQLLYLARSKTS